MKKFLTVLAVSAFFAATTNAQMELPQPSPKALIKNTVGLTDITIDYSSPAVKGRTVWGDLVPYNDLWRTGANSASKITFSKDVEIAGKRVAAGNYSILSIPGKDEWTIIVNNDSELRGTSGYAQDKDAVRLQVKPNTVPHRERLTFFINDYSDAGGVISMEWEKLQLNIPFKTFTDEQALKNIQSTLNGSWRNFMAAARYNLDNNKDLDQGITWINQAIVLDNSQWFSYWVKAQLHAGKSQWNDARTAAAKAKELGDKNPNNFWYKEDVEKAIADWKVKK
jgi:hypothetical protein